MSDEATVWNPGSTPLVNSDGTVKRQYFVATAAQSVFNLTAFAYALSTESLQIYKNGLALRLGLDFNETSTSSFTLTTPATAGDIIIAIGYVGITGVVNIPGNGTVTYASLAIGFALTNTELPIVSLAKGGLGQAFADLAAVKTYLGIVSSPVQITQEGIMNVLTPSPLGRGFKDIISSGWLPAFINDLWGGAVAPFWLTDQATGVEYRFTSNTQQIDDNGFANCGALAANAAIAQGFQLSRDLSNETLVIWVKIYKVGAPSGASVHLYASTGTAPTGAPLFSSGLPTPDTVTTSTEGSWYRIAFSNVTLSANTQYHFAITSGAVDAANYWVSKTDQTNRTYPLGSFANGTAAPVWSPNTAVALCFITELPVNKQMLQSSGLLSGAIVFHEAVNPVLSSLLCNSMQNIWDGEEATWIFTGTQFQINKPFFDCVYGLTKNRITGAVDNFGNVTFSCYDALGTLRTTSSLGVNVVTGNRQIVLSIRSKGDGVDSMTIHIDGVQSGSGLSNISISFNDRFRELGTVWLGGGFNGIPSWSDELTMNVLPSSSGWTYSGSNVEATAFKLNNSRLYQVKNTATLTAIYTKPTAGLNNGTGWTVSFTANVTDATRTAFSQASTVNIFDGAKQTGYMLQDYFVSYSNDLATYLNSDLHTTTRVENEYLICGRASDQYMFVNGRFMRDGSGTLTTVSASNQIVFGDNSAVAGEGNSVIWDNMAYAGTTYFMPVASNGLRLSEFVALKGNQTNNITAFFNTAPISVKDFAGIAGGYIEKLKHTVSKKGVLANTTTTSVAQLPIVDMSTYVIGKNLDVEYTGTLSNSAAQVNTVTTSIDGETAPYFDRSATTPAAALNEITARVKVSRYFGLHRVEARARSATGTITHTSTNRELIVEGES